MCCEGKKSNRCGNVQFAACSRYESELPEVSKLDPDGCYSVEEVISDLYGIAQENSDNTDLSDLLTNGISYTLVDGKVSVKNALKKHAELLLAYKDKLDKIENGTHEIFKISGWGLDFGGLADECNNPPMYLKDLLQIIINEINQ